MDQIMFHLPNADKKALIEAIKKHNAKNPMQKVTYSKLLYPTVKKFIKENK